MCKKVKELRLCQRVKDTALDLKAKVKFAISKSDNTHPLFLKKLEEQSNVLDTLRRAFVIMMIFIHVGYQIMRMRSCVENKLNVTMAYQWLLWLTTVGLLFLKRSHVS